MSALDTHIARQTTHGPIMLSDYAKSAERHKKQLAKNNKPAKFPVVLLLLAIACVGAFGWFLFKLAKIEPRSIAAPPEEQLQPSVEAAQTQAPAQDAQDRYDFYRLLPESEVLVPEVAEYAASNDFKNGAGERVYLLQAGSFRDRNDANKLRGKLILEGLEVEVSAVTNASGVTWHRILVGPFNSRSKLNWAQDILAKNNTESMVLELKSASR